MGVLHVTEVRLEKAVKKGGLRLNSGTGRGRREGRLIRAKIPFHCSIIVFYKCGERSMELILSL